MSKGKTIFCQPIEVTGRYAGEVKFVCFRDMFGTMDVATYSSVDQGIQNPSQAMKRFARTTGFVAGETEYLILPMIRMSNAAVAEYRERVRGCKVGTEL